MPDSDYFGNVPSGSEEPGGSELEELVGRFVDAIDPDRLELSPAQRELFDELAAAVESDELELELDDEDELDAEGDD